MMMMVEPAHKKEQRPCSNNNMLPIVKNCPLLRKAMSDVTMEISKISKDLESIAESDSSSSSNSEDDDDDDDDGETVTFQAECECCGLKEECTKEYIKKIRSSHSGKWVCGLCSEAVKERLQKRKVAVEEAVTKHTDFVKEFNTTTRVNPKLSFASAMRGIAKKSSEKRQGCSSSSSSSSSSSRIKRTSSCVPRIDI